MLELMLDIEPWCIVGSSPLEAPDKFKYERDDAILTNNLYDRLFELNVNNYKSKVKNRWNELYSNSLFEDIIFDLQSKIDQITESAAGNRENLRWEIETNYNHKFDYIKSWLETRLVIFDLYINETF